jgi:NCS1 family nucleobase:cation symporter-1
MTLVARAAPPATPAVDGPSPRLHNADLAPVPVRERTWTRWHFAALWVGMAVCIPSYTLAAALLGQGMSWEQALLTVLLGNLIVLVPLTLNAHAGTKYGIPFPVLLRASFGTLGANVPALMRALVACGWFGIQTWIGGAAIYTIVRVLAELPPPGPESLIPFLALSPGQLGCFLAFWLLNMAVVWGGIDIIRGLESWAAPVLIGLGFALLGWAVTEAGGLGVVLSDDTVSTLRGTLPGDYSFWRVFWPGLAAVVGFWATLSLNIPDFTRYARSQTDQVVGQVVGLPGTMTLVAFIGLAVTSATVVIFGEAVWDPVELTGRFTSGLVLVVSLVAVALATLSTNVAANVVSPANDFANLWPERVSFRVGGTITGVIGILIMPWRLYTDLAAYLFTWLVGYGTLLGAIAGVMLVDYYLLRRARLDLTGLYRDHGPYRYRSGYNPRALLALVTGIAPAVPGFLEQATGGAVTVPSAYTYGWFASLAVSGLTYAALMIRYAQGEETDDAGAPIAAPIAPDPFNR